VAFHECGFSVPADRFIRGVLFAYGLQLQHLNPKASNRWMPLRQCVWGSSASVHSVPVFLQVHQLEGGMSRSDDWLRQPSDEARSERRLHPGTADQLEQRLAQWWFYLRNDPEHALPSYTGCSIAKSQRNWAKGTAKAEQEKMLKSHWAVLGHLQNAKITLEEVVEQYHARGVVPLQRRPLRLCDMTTDRSPWAGTVTALEPPSPLEVQRRVAQAIGRATYLCPPSRMLPMLPNAGTEKFVSCLSSR
jgi:hypothetical protein